MKRKNSIVCENCGKKLTTCHSNKKYCNKLCKANFLRKKNNNIIREERRKCFYCGKYFIWKSSVPQQLYCSKKCCLKITRKRYMKMYNGNFLGLRFKVFERDNFTCQYCGRNVKDDKVKLQIDHIIPQSKGGKDVFSNLMTACSECNNGKSDVLLSLRTISLIHNHGITKN